jgi:hypothetical protein
LIRTLFIGAACGDDRRFQLCVWEQELEERYRASDRPATISFAKQVRRNRRAPPGSVRIIRKRLDTMLYFRAPLPEDIEIELEPCYGLSGLIRARNVSIAFEPGKPIAQDG